MIKFITLFCVILLTSYYANAQQATQVLQASTSAISNLNQLTAQSRQQLSTIYRTSHAKLLEISTNRNLNETLRAQELANIRRILKNQLANWRSVFHEKLQFMEKDMQNAIDLIFERPINNNIFNK